MHPTPERARPERLHELINLLVECPPSRPTAFGVQGLARVDDVELAMKPLPTGNLVRDLSGFRAPLTWDAFGIVAPARAFHLDDDDPPIPVTLAVIVARDGGVTSAVHGIESRGAGTRRDDGEGRVLDACRRVLGLPTPPPDVSTGWWSALHWIDRVLAALLDADLGHPPSWSTLRGLDEGRRYATAPWALLRGDCAAGAIDIPGIAAAGAAWMDDGMFSREAISGYPPLFDMLDDVDALVSADTFERLVRQLCELILL